MASQVESIKWVPGTNFLVDGFGFVNPRCRHYFLTHAHSDHTTGLGRRFGAGTIYCSEVTAALLLHDHGLRPASAVVALRLGVRVEIEGVGVTPLDANHCPGAVMFLFEVRLRCGGGGNGGDGHGGDGDGDGSFRSSSIGGSYHGGGGGGGVGDGVAGGAGAVRCILHTGDCRWSPALLPGVLASLAGRPLHTLFLDTTYCHPRHDFPCQDSAIQGMVQAMRRALEEEPATLFVASAYHIGKERSIFGAAQALGLRVWATPAKRRVLALLGLPPDWLQLLETQEPAAAQIHISDWGLQAEQLEQLLEQQAQTPPQGQQQAQTPHQQQQQEVLQQHQQLGPGVVVQCRKMQTETQQQQQQQGGQKPGGEVTQHAPLQSLQQQVQAQPAGNLLQDDQQPGEGGASRRHGSPGSWEEAKKALPCYDPAGAGCGCGDSSSSSGCDGLEVGGGSGGGGGGGGPWRQVVGIRATGWTFRRSAGAAPQLRRLSGRAALLSAAYSEHSSWGELRACVRALRPARLVPTVNAPNPVAARAIVDRFADLMELRWDRSRLDAYLVRPPPTPPLQASVEGDGVRGESSAAAELLGAQPCPAAAGSAAAAPAAAGLTHALVARRLAGGGLPPPLSAESGDEVDLGAVDVAEQERIWRQLQAARAAAARRAAALAPPTAAAKRRRAGGGDDATGAPPSRARAPGGGAGGRSAGGSAAVGAASIRHFFRAADRLGGT